jgi:hypothetical protein
MIRKIQSGPIWKAAMTVLICACALGGCSSGAKSQAEAEEKEAIARTEFTGRIENFFEYEPLKAGKPSQFRIHLTDLSDGSPVEKAEVKLTIRAKGGGASAGETTVLIDTPEHQLTMVIQNFDEFSGIRFKSMSKSYISFGDRELWFIVDGKRMRIDTASESKAPSNLQDEDEKGRTPWTTLITSMSLPQLEEIVSGNKVEMRLGTVEVTWSQSVLDNMREYVRTLASYAPSRQKSRGRRPW